MLLDVFRILRVDHGKAIASLGLSMEKKRENAEMLIVDHCEQLPTEN